MKFCDSEEMAIHILEFIKDSYNKPSDNGGKLKYVEALDMGIEALKKTIPQKPTTKISKPDAYGDRVIYFRCPKCDSWLDSLLLEDLHNEYLRREPKACHECQQIIDWSDDDAEINLC